MRYLIKILFVFMLACCCHAQGKSRIDATPATNAVSAKVETEKERKAEHQLNKITVKARDKGSKKESDYKTEREFPLMFANNRKAKKTTPKKEGKTQ